MVSWTFSGTMAGVAGAFYIWYSTIIIPGLFIADVTFFVWTAVIIGGLGNNRGAMLGGFLFMFLYEVLRFIPDVIPALGAYAEELTSIRIALVGVALIIVLRVRSYGLFAEGPQKLRVRGA